MDFRKADSKGRVSGFQPGEVYFVTGPLEGRYHLRPVPVVETIPEGYEPIEVSEMKDAALNALYDAGLDEEAHDFIGIADRVTEAMLEIVNVSPKEHP